MTDDERRLLELLAGSDGCTDALLLAHGLAHDTMVDMVGVGFATAKAEHVFTPPASRSRSPGCGSPAPRRALAASRPGARTRLNQTRPPNVIGFGCFRLRAKAAEPRRLYAQLAAPGLLTR
jgi:hypothetical protein